MKRIVGASGMRIACVALLLVLLSVGAFAGVAWAHADLIRSSPGTGAVLFLAPLDGGGIAPFTLRAWFTERIEPRFSVFEVRDGEGRRVEVANSFAVTSDGASASIEVRPLAAGVHTVDYRMLSADDGHITSGRFEIFVAEARPGEGDRLAELPDRLEMSVPSALGARSITVTVMRGGERLLTASADFVDEGDRHVASLELPEGEPGDYEVRWEMSTGAVPKFGSYAFTVNGG